MGVNRIMWGNELLVECLCSLTAFLELLLFQCTKKDPSNVIPLSVE